MSNASGASQRFYDLDALRAVAMFLGIVLHGAIFVLPEQQVFWPVYDPAAEGDPFYQIVLDLIHGFRMPLFFMLSGFFTALLWQRRSLRSLIDQRLKRVAIPFVVSCFTIIPVSVAILQQIAGRIPPYDFPYWQLPIICFGTLGHLWFLWYLLLLSAFFVSAVRLGVQFLHPWAWLMVVPTSAGFSLLMVEPTFGADTAITFIPEPALLFFYACFFVFGVFMYRRSVRVRRWWTAALIPAGLLFWGGYSLIEEYLSAFGGSVQEAGTAFLFKDSLTLFAALLETAFSWAMCFGLMGLFRWVLSRESFAVRYFSDASYWAYLVHVPLVIIAQYLTIDLPVHYHFKFLLVLAGVTVVLLVSYQVAVRYSFIGKALNGPRLPRQSHQEASPE